MKPCSLSAFGGARIGYRVIAGGLAAASLALAQTGTPAAGSATPSGRPATDEPTQLAAFEVTGSRLKQTDIEGVSPVLTFDTTFLLNAGFGTTEEFLRTLPQNFTAATSGRITVPNDENPTLAVRNPGQSGVGLRGLGSNNTLVLIDGRRAPLSGRGNNATTPPQGFFDINTIPMGMIERIEVLTDGASAIYGTDAVGGVINLILKRDFRETELRTRMAGTFDGGAFERGATLTSGYVRGPLKTSLVVDYFAREALMGSQRWFSASADQTPRGGSDFRTNIGYPTTIYALAGQTLRGLTNPNGTPATQAVVPARQDGRGLKAADFAATAGGRTYYSGGGLYSLITPTERHGLTGKGEYKVASWLTVHGDAAYTHNKSTMLANPVITSSQTGATVRIPATNPYNPFGQDLGFIVAHDELGSRRIITNTRSWRGTLGARLRLPRDWSADGSFVYHRQKLHGSTPAADNALVQAALAQTDPAKALNLFGDYYAKGATNAPGVYESIIRATTTDATSDIYNLEGLVRGAVWSLPAGDVQLAAGGEWNQQDRVRTTNNPSSIEPARSREVRNDYAAFAEMSVPLFSRKLERPLLRSLDLSLAARYQNIEDAGATTDPKVGLRWKPFKALLLRGTFGTGYRAPALTELERPEADSNPSTLLDRRRNNERYPIHVVSGSDPNLEPETSKTYNYGFVYNVSAIAGLSFGLDAYRKEQRNLTTSLGTQVLIDNESLFADRIIRAAPTAADTAAGLPGRITDIDGRYLNFGLVVTEGLDYNVHYQQASPRWGRFNFQATASYLAAYKVAFNPGDPLVDRRGTFGFPQKFKGNAYLFWSKSRYGASVACYHQGTIDRSGAAVASYTTFDVSASFEWNRRLRFQGGIGNIFNHEPPFVNMQFGYDGGFHSPKLRTYNLSATYKL
jgi:iron complex outermembrane receptor protein